MINRLLIRVLLSLSSATFIAAISLTSCVAQEARLTTVHLASGVIVDRTSGSVYIMAPGDSIEAIDIGTGELLWRTNDAAKPLAVSGRILLGQASSADDRFLDLVSITTDDSGRVVNEASLQLPPGVVSDIGESLRHRFISEAIGIGDQLYVVWNYSARDVKGAYDGEGEDDEALPATTPVQQTGYVRVSLSTGEAEAIPALPQTAVSQQESLIARRVEASSPPSRIASIDGSHVLTSQRIADDREWNKYEWTISLRGPETIVGHVRSHISQADFTVEDDLILFITNRFIRRIGNEIADEPLSLRAVNLNTGQQVWSREIRDTRLTGPLPP